jgi:acetylornithine/succinyldiaminopimelate/putrescine aminotransferase/predicted amino acid dehydrogenase
LDDLARRLTNGTQHLSTPILKRNLAEFEDQKNVSHNHSGSGTTEFGHLNPERQALMQLAGLHWQFVRGDGVWLFDKSGRRFLDAYAQYGVLALGHNHAAVHTALKNALAGQIPAMVQPYTAVEAEALARRLCEMSNGAYNRCVLTSSGAETVEAAIKLARMHHRRPIIVSAVGSYHGKTMGALAASDRLAFSDAHFQPATGFLRVAYGDSDALARCFETHCGEIAGFIVEPIQGERGVHVPPPGYLKSAKQLCEQHDIAFIADEIQTGLFRTGDKFACDHEGVVPDVMLIAKALGGGIFPLGACLVREKNWDSDFALTHSSTFANNNLASSVALAVLDELETPRFQENLAAISTQLQSGLASLARRFPTRIKAVRGRGMMHAIELRAPEPQAGYFMNYLHHQGLGAYAFASVLAQRCGVLVLPALNDTNVIRIAPPLISQSAHIVELLDALENVFALWQSNAADDIVRSMLPPMRLDIGGNTQPAASNKPKAPVIRLPRSSRHAATEALDYAFIIHPTTPTDTILNDPSFARFTAREFSAYQQWSAQLPAGMVCEIPEIRSAHCARGVRGALIAVPLLPEQMLLKGRDAVCAAIADAVDLAHARGAKIVGLGAFTSIYTRKGTAVVGRGPAITTGNLLTAGMTFEALQQRLREQGLSIRDCRVGLVGARGSVGALVAQLLARSSPREIILIGNPNSDVRALSGIAATLSALSDTPLVTTNDITFLNNCNVIVSSSSSATPVLDGAQIQAGAIVCDVARPFDASPALRARPDIFVIDSGLVRLPGSPISIGAGNLQGHPPGVALACLSETILLALARAARDYGIGDNVAISEVDAVLKLAREHGFFLSENTLPQVHNPANEASIGRARSMPAAEIA